MNFQREQISNYKYFTLIVTFLFFLTLIFVIIFPDKTGMADNCDFMRTMGKLGISHIPSFTGDRSCFKFFDIYYNKSGNYNFPSTLSQAIAYIALFINNIISSSESFNILYLSSIYIILYTLAFYTLVKTALAHMQVPILIKSLLALWFIFILTDGNIYILF